MLPAWCDTLRRASSFPVTAGLTIHDTPLPNDAPNELFWGILSFSSRWTCVYDVKKLNIFSQASSYTYFGAEYFSTLGT